MGLDDRAADRQPHTQPIDLGREERLEDPVEVGFGDALARVVHSDFDIRRGRDRGPHGHLPRRSSPVRGSRDGVGEEIQDHLLDLDHIAVDRRQRGRGVELDRDGMQECLVRDERDRPRGEIVEHQRNTDEVSLLEQSPYAQDDLARAPVVTDDVGDTRAQLLEIRRRGGQQPGRRLRVEEDGRQRLVQLVSEGRGQPATRSRWAI
jgi:hypothetical protein